MTKNAATKSAARARAERDHVPYTAALAAEQVLAHPLVDEHLTFLPTPVLLSYLPLMNHLEHPWRLRNDNGWFRLVHTVDGVETAVGSFTRQSWEEVAADAAEIGGPELTPQDFIGGVSDLDRSAVLDDLYLIYVSRYRPEGEGPVLLPQTDPPVGEMIDDALVVTNHRDGRFVEQVASALNWIIG